MYLSPLTLCTDSLIAAVALSPAVRPRHYAPLAALFGACDMAGSMLAPVLGARVAASTLLVPWLLLLWGALVVFDAFDPVRLARSRKSDAWAYLLPPLLAIDNLVVPGVTPALAGLLSLVMAAVGFGMGGALLRQPVSVLQRRYWRAGSLIVVGLLLAV